MTLVVNCCFHLKGPGRPPRNPVGLFKAYLAKQFLNISSMRALERRLWNDERLRAICNLEADEPAYGRTVLSRFNKRLGTRKMRRLVERQVEKLLRKGMVKAETVAVDATFIKAYSRRDHDKKRGYSDAEARVGRAYRTYGLGYKLHLSVDTASGEPLTFTVAPANANEKRFSIPLLNAVMKFPRSRIREVTADTQYSSRRFRAYTESSGMVTAVPYAANQKPPCDGVLRVDRDFRTHGPVQLRRLYRKRSIIELVFAQLKEHLSLTVHKVRGIAKIIIHVGYCLLCLLFIVEASYNSNQPVKARSITYWAN